MRSHSRSSNSVIPKAKPVISSRIETFYNSGMLCIKLPGASLNSTVSVTLYSMNGQIIKRVFQNNSRETIGIPFLGIAPCLYAVAVACGAGKYSGRIMIPH
jgi:hypothetical protein